jgi:hypothetical protein
MKKSIARDKFMKKKKKKQRKEKTNGDHGHQLVPPGDDEGGTYLCPTGDAGLNFSVQHDIGGSTNAHSRLRRIR